MDHRSDRLFDMDFRIAQAEMAVMLQIVEIDKLRVAGRDTAVAERALLAFVASLEAIRERRKLIAQSSHRYIT
jgi:hypothetical protein